MFCHENDSYVTPSTDMFPLAIVVKENQITGSYGKCIDQFLVNKPIRKCRILGGIEVGEKLPNSSFSGILGMIERKEIDLYLRGEPDFVQEDWLAKTIPIELSSVLVGHIVHRDRNDVIFFNLLHNFNFGLTLTATYLFSFIAIPMICFCVHLISGRVRFEKGSGVDKAIQKTFATLGSFRKNRLSAIGLFVLCTQFFFLITQLLLTNNIKTNQVVVDTSDLIKNLHEIRSTPKVCCILKQGLLYKQIMSSPPGSLLGMLYEKTKFRPEMQEERELFGDRCLLGIDLFKFSMYSQSMKLAASKDIFVAGEKDNGNLFWSTGYVFKGLFNVAWMLSDAVPYNLVFYYNPSKPRIGWETLRSSEIGMTNRMYECIENQAKMSLHRNQISVFANLKDFVQQFSGFSDLLLENFRSIFFFYFLFGLLVFAVAFGHYGLVMVAVQITWCFDSNQFDIRAYTVHRG